MRRIVLGVIFVLAILPFDYARFAKAESRRPFIDFSAPGALNQLKPSSQKVRLSPTAGGALAVTCAAGPDQYPGITITPSRPWDLSAFGHVAARVTNTGHGPIVLCLRVDNDGDWRDNPFDGENLELGPGKSGVIEVIFGYSWGNQPSFKLNPAAVVRILLFAGKSEKEEQSFRIDSLEAGGPPGQTPPPKPPALDEIRVAPPEGEIVGPHVNIKSQLQLESAGARATVGDFGLRVDFTAGSAEETVSLRPSAGRWDLRQFLQVALEVKNDGTIPAAPRFRLDSNSGATDWVVPLAPIAPGATVQLVIPFASQLIWDGSRDSGNHFASDAASRLTISMENPAANISLILQSAIASRPDPRIPDWLGKRPPVEGDWTRTFDDEFDGNQVDQSKWTTIGENYYDKQSHFSREQVIVGNGAGRLRFEKKRGYQNDDTARKPATDYATGFLQTFGKWSQRYGYFESRMKLPAAPGLWPAFWVMPDRGPKASEGARQDTANGGMEFDIMEHLSRWGPYRFNIAMHWDGYGEHHQSTGTDRIYFCPDAEGFITAGLLWTPGSLVYYVNGKAVLRWDSPRVSNVPGEMMFTLPMGGWDNDSLDDRKLPDDFVIDYVRVWQRKDLGALP